MAKFRVIFPHLGDRMYLEGDTREADLLDVKHLVENGVLSPEQPEQPAEAETAAPKGKGKK